METLELFMAKIAEQFVSVNKEWLSGQFESSFPKLLKFLHQTCFMQNRWTKPLKILLPQFVESTASLPNRGADPLVSRKNQ